MKGIKYNENCAGEYSTVTSIKLNHHAHTHNESYFPLHSYIRSLSSSFTNTPTSAADSSLSLACGSALANFGRPLPKIPFPRKTTHTRLWPPLAPTPRIPPPPARVTLRPQISLLASWSCLAVCAPRRCRCRWLEASHREHPRHRERGSHRSDRRDFRT